MNKKTLIACLALALLFLAGIGAAVFFLYREDKGGTPSRVSASQFPLLKAVPSDAAAILCLGSVQDGTALLTDGTTVFSSLVYDSVHDSYGSFLRALGEGLSGGDLSSLRSQPMAVSLHFSGSLVPLIAVGMPRAATDSSRVVTDVLGMAASAGLSGGFFASEDDRMVLVSSSETLVNSSVRHQGEGLSILANKDFAASLAGAASKDVLFLSNNYAGKLLPAYFQRPLSRHSDFIRTLSSWTLLSITSRSEKSLSIRGFLSSAKSAEAFAGVFKSAPMETPGFQSVIPSGSVYALSVPFDDQAEYLSAYRKYLDSQTRLGKNESSRNSLRKSSGVVPDDWAKALAIKEVAKARWSTPDGTHDALFVRVGHKDYSLIFKGLDARNEKEYSLSSQDYAFGGFAAALFGSAFSLPDESCFAFTGEWLVSGSRDAIDDYVDRYSSGDVLQALLSDASVSVPSLGRDCSYAAYFSAGAGISEGIFAPSMLSAVTSTLNGAAYEPVILTGTGDTFQIETVRVPFITKSSTPAVVSDAAVEIPRGPFEVMNSGTGQKNLLAQQSNYYLSLKEENGKGIWSIPFQEPLCGAVESIDYYNNGKIQFLFAAGSKLYLLDRLGRFVSGFPVEIGKTVLLGPSVHDFTGAKGYTVLVLHDDNTIGMYNLHGTLPSEWKGIAPDEKITSLPELVETGGSKYWAVRTAVQTQIFPFYGGEAVYKHDGAKAIRRDSAIEPDGKSVKVTCNDGKTRSIKLQ